MEEGSRSTFEDVKEEILEENRQSFMRIGNTLEGRVVEEYVVENVGEELERELIEVVEEVQLVEDEEDVTPRLR